MEITSLAWRTDIAILEQSGSTVTDCGTHLLVTTPDNPAFRWGNFMLLQQAPLPGGAREVMGAFDSWFRTNRHRAIGVDAGVEVDTAEFAAAGMEAGVAEVMTAERLVAPERPFVEGGIRPLTSDEWDKWVDLELGAMGQEGRQRESRDYLRARARAEQRLVDAGLGRRWGVFVDGRLAASAGIYDTGDGVYRYRAVLTHSRQRGRGICSTLIHRMGQWALARPGARQLVIVADPDGPAINVYRRLGFETTETVTELFQMLPGRIA
ncbi:GNAT family N-acetyltransferase [Nocardioides sp. Y6]|uniref:GNAT family N-acetyltransferase n=1 Tax=Nocardioides malaquae TaxID=2773426 RepID=A0ABR9RWF4_9ACTN|nr:GNAT family N-acetyltransferase [Nocardioides malaquae]MBE7325863.1 GNAT family N-acetyltransferase [Nocardioides malaquae]